MEHLLDRYILPKEHRGDGIYAVGRKRRGVRDRYPSWLYAKEPGQMDIVEAFAEGAAIHLRFRPDQPGVIGWQLYDPSTGAFLQEGEWAEINGPEADLRIPLPAEEGAYRVQVAPVKDRARFIAIDALVGAGVPGGVPGMTLHIGTPRVVTRRVRASYAAAAGRPQGVSLARPKYLAQSQADAVDGPPRHHGALPRQFRRHGVDVPESAAADGDLLFRVRRGAADAL